jgi:arabinofuranosyltransferase
MPRLALAFALLLDAVSLGATSWRLGDWVVDDAFIVFRYAVNWVGGQGPVYNPGEWVEGYSSPVWLALIAGAHAAGVDPVHAARVWGTASVVGALVLLAFDRDPRRAALAVLLAGTSGSLLAWAGGGLETTLAAAVALVAWVGHREARPWAPVVAALAPLVRPELALVPALQLADHLLSGRRRAAATLGLTCLALVGGHALLRWWAYADWVPNPAHAKVGATSEQVLRGLGHLRRWAPWGGPLVVAAFVALRDRATAAPVAWVALHVAFVVAVGGDALPAWRFFVPLVPTAAWLAASSVRSRPGELALVGVVAWQLAGPWLDWRLSPRDAEDTVTERGREVGLWLRDHFPPDTVLATNTAGTVPYYSGFVAIDMLGLCDRTIARRPIASMGRGQAGHEKGDGAYVLSRAPDLVMFGAAPGKRTPAYRSDRELFASPAFREGWVLEGALLPSGRRAVWYRRVDAPAALPVP